jgi:hypothetical protein
MLGQLATCVCVCAHACACACACACARAQRTKRQQKERKRKRKREKEAGTYDAELFHVAVAVEEDEGVERERLGGAVAVDRRVARLDAAQLEQQELDVAPVRLPGGVEPHLLLHPGQVGLEPALQGGRDVAAERRLEQVVPIGPHKVGGDVALQVAGTPHGDVVRVDGVGLHGQAGPAGGVALVSEGARGHWMNKYKND